MDENYFDEKGKKCRENYLDENAFVEIIIVTRKMSSKFGTKLFRRNLGAANSIDRITVR